MAAQVVQLLPVQVGQFAEQASGQKPVAFGVAPGALQAVQLAPTPEQVAHWAAQVSEQVAVGVDALTWKPATQAVQALPEHAEQLPGQAAGQKDALLGLAPGAEQVRQVLAAPVQVAQAVALQAEQVPLPSAEVRKKPGRQAVQLRPVAAEQPAGSAAGQKPVASGVSPAAVQAVQFVRTPEQVAHWAAQVSEQTAGVTVALTWKPAEQAEQALPVQAVHCAGQAAGQNCEASGVTLPLAQAVQPLAEAEQVAQAVTLHCGQALMPGSVPS